MIERVAGYWQDEELGRPHASLSIGIESRKLKACIKKTIALNANGVFGAPYFGFLEDNLDFLAELNHLEAIWFFDVELTDIEGLYALKNLKYFGVHPKRPAIDFSGLKSLQSVVLEYKRKDAGLASLRKLKSFDLWRYNPKSRSFDGFEFPDRISELQINWANVTSLVGLPVLPKLRRLEIARCRNLETISELPNIAPNLRHLVVEACGRVRDGAKVVKRLTKLNHAVVGKELLV